jgi:hypothetical protein
MTFPIRPLLVMSSLWPTLSGVFSDLRTHEGLEQEHRAEVAPAHQATLPASLNYRRDTAIA